MDFRKYSAFLPQHRAARATARALPVALGLAFLAAGCSSQSSPGASAPAVQTGASGFAGAALPPGPRPPAVTLSDQAGRRVSLSALHGRVSILAFLYTRCGAACTVIAQQIRGALDDLGGAVPVLIVSADPAADTPASVRAFLSRVGLSARVRYLTGSRAQLAAAWGAFHVVPPSAGRAAFARSAPVYVLDRAGRPRVIFQLEQLTPEGLAHDVRAAQREGR
jgi:protein SCO1